MDELILLFEPRGFLNLKMISSLLLSLLYYLGVMRKRSIEDRIEYKTDSLQQQQKTFDLGSLFIEHPKYPLTYPKI